MGQSTISQRQAHYTPVAEFSQGERSEVEGRDWEALRKEKEAYYQLYHLERRKNEKAMEFIRSVTQAITIACPQLQPKSSRVADANNK